MNQVAKPRRILLIEDNADSAESMKLLLTLNGHEVEVARNGQDGIAQARMFLPEVVLCDIGLPGPLSGYDVARTLRRDNRCATVCLIAFTGYGQKEDQRRVRDAGFHVHLVKPIESERLLRAVSEASPSGAPEEVGS